MRGCDEPLPKSRGLQPARRLGPNGAPHAPCAASAFVPVRTAIGSFTLVARPRGLKPAARCRAFSLAEVMIAIGILGVGLLMVAATFPVGLDQSRIVAEETIKPLVADEAFQRLEALIHEPATFKRIPPDASAPDFTKPAIWRSIRESLQAIAVQQLTSNIPVGPIRSHLSNGDATQDPASSTVTLPYQWTGLNELLVAPYVPPANVGEAPQVPGAATRFYPSIAAKYSGSPTAGWKWSLPLRTNAAGNPISVEPPYTWSALYRVYSVVQATTPPVITNYVQFFVFVNRRGEDWPRDWPYPVSFGVVGAKRRENEIWITPNFSGAANGTLIKQFSEGGYLVLDNYSAVAVVCRIKQIELAKDPTNADLDSTDPGAFHRLVLDRATDAAGFWFVPADASTGRSPCIGVYSRTFVLQ